MYIPKPQDRFPDAAAPGYPRGTVEADSHILHPHSVSALFRFLSSPFYAHADSDGSGSSVLDKRQFSSDQGRNTNITIGIILAFLIPAFLGLVIAFLFYYRGSVFCFERKKKRHRRHRSMGSKSSSKSSRHSDTGPPPPPPPPPVHDGPPPPPPPPPV